ncbi:hypothetical protein HK099_002558 [Clydaea vesicula]|uniref:Uncharacterized protein n=1 Tax=Clydaea vesicula TaxID=447962 RepID=A0AAD5XWI9_9FUNG|nr:hypothetical protein HK099_002558 [Clydaea vesicula]
MKLRNRQQLNAHKKIPCRLNEFEENENNIESAPIFNNLESKIPPKKKLLMLDTNKNEIDNSNLLDFNEKKEFSKLKMLNSSSSSSSSFESFDNFYTPDQEIFSLKNNKKIKLNDEFFLITPNTSSSPRRKYLTAVDFVTVDKEDIYFERDRLENLCESFAELKLNSISQSLCSASLIGVNVLFYWGLCSSLTESLNIDIPDNIKYSFIKVYKYSGVIGKVSPTVQFEFSMKINSLKIDKNFNKKISNALTDYKIKKVYGNFIYNIVLNISKNLGQISQEILQYYNFSSSFQKTSVIPLYNKMSPLKQFLIAIVKVIKQSIIDDICNEDEMIFLEAIENTQLYRSPLDCTGQSLVLKILPLFNFEKIEMEKKNCILQLVRILQLEVNEVCKKVLSNKNFEKAFKQTCCLGLICGFNNEVKFQMDYIVDIQSGQFGKFYFVFRLGCDVDFVFDKIIDINEFVLRPVDVF